MAGRCYKSVIDNVSIGTAVQDIFSIKSAAGIGLVLEAIHLDSTNTSAASLRMRLKRGTATVTQGSGGTNQTPAAVSSKDQGTHAATYHINDTTQATTSGSFYNLAMFNWDTVGPFDYIPAQDDTKPDCLASECLILDLPATITATTVSGFIIIREVP
jgi:hypothetical protein